MEIFKFLLVRLEKHHESIVFIESDDLWIVDCINHKVSRSSHILSGLIAMVLILLPYPHLRDGLADCAGADGGGVGVFGEAHKHIAGLQADIVRGALL